MRSLAYNKLGLVASSAEAPEEFGFYEITPELKFVPVDDSASAAKLVKNVRQPMGTVSVDEASVILIEEGKRYRLPLNPDYIKERSVSQKRAGDLESLLPKSLTEKAKVAVSSEHGEYRAQFATDGKISDDSRWIGREGESSWIELDLGAPKTIASIWVVSGWKREESYVAGDFDVQVMADEKWRTVEGGKVRGNRSTEKEIRLAEPITAQKIRIQAANQLFFRIYEVAAFDYVPEIDSNQIFDLGPARVCREVATERDLLNVHGSVYELPARNAQGLAKVRPIATHNLAIQDFCSHNGLLFFTGVDAATESDHIFRSDDGKAAVWAGVIDDLWKMGKPRGRGGPWMHSEVKAGVPSDPYLMTGYDRKSFTLESSATAEIRIEVDVDGTGLWVPFAKYETAPGEVIAKEFPEGFSAYWVRAISDTDSTCSFQLEYQ